MGKLGSHFFSDISLSLCLRRTDYIQSHHTLPGLAVKCTILVILFINFKLLNSRGNLVFIHYLMIAFGVQPQGRLYGWHYRTQKEVKGSYLFVCFCFGGYLTAKEFSNTVLFQTSLYSFAFTLIFLLSF